QMNLWSSDSADAGFPKAMGALEVLGTRTARVGVRPEHLVLDPGGVPGRVVLREILGRDLLLHVESNGSRFLALVDSLTASRVAEGDSASFVADPENWHYFDTETGARLHIAPPARSRARADAL